MMDDKPQLELALGTDPPAVTGDDPQTCGPDPGAGRKKSRSRTRRGRETADKPEPGRRPRARQSRTAPVENGTMPADVRTLLGPPALPRWESHEDFECFRSALAAEFKPQTLTDWMIIDDVAYAAIGVARVRRAQAVGLGLAQKDATTKLLLANSSWEAGTSEYPSQSMIKIAADFVGGDKDAKKIIGIIMKSMGLAPDAVGSTSVLARLALCEQLDAMTERNIVRRDTGIRELMRRKASRSATSAASTDDITDADYQ